MSPAENPTIVGSAEEFEDAVAEGEVLVDFYADRCAPCEKMETAIEEVAEEGVDVVRVDTEENPGAASEHGVRSVPTLVVFEDGGAVRRAVGARSADGVRGFVDG